MSPPSSTLCFLSCFPLSLFTSVIVNLYLLPLTSYVHIKDPCLASSKAGNLCPPFLALSHAFTSFGTCGSVSLPAVAWCACLSVAAYCRGLVRGSKVAARHVQGHG